MTKSSSQAGELVSCIGAATRKKLASKPIGWFPLPEGMTTEQAMAIGTAGFTAMLADGEVLVTGAAGGVGSVAIAILHRLGYFVVASTGRQSEHDYLKGLGAALVIDRAVLAIPPARPLDSERWAGAIDAVGGTTLATLLTQMRHRTSVSAVGNAGGLELKTTVLPFLLRGVNLLGIDSVMSPLENARKPGAASPKNCRRTNWTQ